MTLNPISDRRTALLSRWPKTTTFSSLLDLSLSLSPSLYFSLFLSLTLSVSLYLAFYLTISPSPSLWLPLSLLLPVSSTTLLHLTVSYLISPSSFLFFATIHSINRGAYWDHAITDAEWAAHCETLDLQNLITASNSKFE